MRKKILDVAIVSLFYTCLFVASNIQERAETIEFDEIADVQSIQTGAEQGKPTAEEEIHVSAGVCQVISDNSFTTESDEKTGIEKKDVIIVTSSIDSNGNDEQEKVEENETEMIENTSEDEVAEPEIPVYENRWNITLTSDEIDLLAKIVWLEACGEPVEGQEAVVEVIFNRITSDLYPNTLYDVLSQGNPTQFCSWKNRDIAQPTETEYQSIYNVLNGNTNLLRNDTMYFSTFQLTSNLDVKICCHCFYY